MNMELFKFIGSIAFNNTFLTILSIGCTIFSAIGAWKSFKYYKKSRQITIYTNTNVALLEIEKIQDVLTDMLKLSNKSNKQRQLRGMSYENIVGENGEKIKKSINIIRKYVTYEDIKEIEKVLNSENMKVEQYIDSFITGSVLVDGKFIVDEQFKKCQEIFKSINLLMKKKLEEREENLK